MHAAVLEKATRTRILSLYLANKLAISLTELTPIRTDMCPASCIAYTGHYENSVTCPYLLGNHVENHAINLEQHHLERENHMHK
jgi:hypothetical protein